MPLDPRMTIVRAVVLVVWGLIVGSGLLLLGEYHARPSSAGAASGSWPAESRVHFDESRPNLLLFLHPRCPCSPASVAELADVVARGRGRFTPHVVVFQPSRPSEDWGRTRIEREAAA